VAIKSNNAKKKNCTKTKTEPGLLAFYNIRPEMKWVYSINP